MKGQITHCGSSLHRVDLAMQANDLFESTIRFLFFNSLNEKIGMKITPYMDSSRLTS